ncbi:hypothetical protein JCM1841_002532 [Sporobolomyces salmonicolor]
MTTGNYSTWLHRLTLHLTVQGKGHCIHGDPVARRGSDEKADQYEAQVWRREKEESCALDLIYSIIDDSNAAFIEPATTTRATLDLLQSHHGAANIHTVVQLVGELFNAHLTPGGNLDAHLTRMRHIQNGLVAQARDRHGAQAASADNLEVDIHFSDAAIAAIILHSLPSPQFSALRTAIFNDSSKKLTTAIVFEQIANKVATNGGSRSTPSPSITALAAQAAPSRAYDGLSVTLSDVLLVPGLAINLISVSRICQAGNKTVVFSGDLATIVDRHGSVLVRGVRHGKIYRLLTSTVISAI